MSTLHYLWHWIFSLTQRLTGRLDQRDQHVIEFYLSQSQSMPDLERRERELMRW